MREDLQAVIEGSKLNSADKQLWEEALVLLNDDQAKVFVDYIEDDPDKLEFLTNNLRMKKEAIANDDGEMLDQILATEEEALNIL
jgi:uncharacterized membrane protein YvbJ